MRRVRLRAYTLGDFDGLYEWMTDPESVKHLGGGFVSPRSQNDVYEYLTDKTEGELSEESFVIADAETGEYLGECGLQLPDRRAKKAELAVVVLPRFRGQGVARAAICKLLRYAFEERDYNRVYLKCAAANKGALRLYESLGFQKEGVLRSDLVIDGEYEDTVIMGMLKKEWK